MIHRHANGWTVETLKIHMETMMAEQDRRYEQVAIASEKALQAALQAVKESTVENKINADKWREHQNEWRQAMTDKDRSFVTKTTLWGYLIGAIGMVLALVQILERFVK